MGIQILAPDVTARIAAGEVVERPASIIKELVENAIDAGATKITVDLTNGGIAMLKVADNGCGIARDDLPLALERHATSKIATFDDLNVLHTLGFRGEALASIGSVAHLAVASRVADTPSGARIVMEHGEIHAVESIAMPYGTIITVRDVFLRVPARLKFLKSPNSEAASCVQILERYAMAYPAIQFQVSHDNRMALRTAGDGSLTQAFAQVYDVQTAEHMTPLTFESDPDDQEQTIRVKGITSRPVVFKTTRQHVYLFVNQRWVKNQTLAYAIEEAYHSLLLTGRHPIAVVMIEIDPALVDVNVHPAKTEVKFARERQVYAAVQRAIRHAIIDATEAPAMTSRPFVTPTPPVGGGYAPLLRPTSPIPVSHSSTQPLWNTAEHETGQSSPPAASVATPKPETTLPILRVLGQMSQSYIVTEGPDGMYLIDQHAAHERILLEKMVAQWQASSLAAQSLMEPIVIELTPEQFATLDEHQQDLVKMQFEMEPFGISTIIVRAVPDLLAKHLTPTSLAEFLADLTGRDAGDHFGTWEEHVLANIACHAAIKAGQSLSIEEQRELIRQLEKTKAPHSCCHGRPTTVHVSLDALQREFARR